MPEHPGVSRPPRLFRVFIEGYCEVWEDESDQPSDPVDAVKEALEPFGFDGVVRLLRE